MAKLNTYMADGIRTGVRQNITAQVVFFVDVGDGKFDEFSQYATRFSGKGKIFNLDLSVNLKLHLKDENVSSKSGICTIDFNGGKDNNATYRALKKYLEIKCKFDGKAHTLKISRVGNGKLTQIDAEGPNIPWPNKVKIRLKQK